MLWAISHIDHSSIAARQNSVVTVMASCASHAVIVEVMMGSSVQLQEQDAPVKMTAQQMAGMMVEEGASRKQD